MFFFRKEDVFFERTEGCNGFECAAGWILTKDSSLKSTRIGIGEKLLSVDGGFHIAIGIKRRRANQSKDISIGCVKNDSGAFNWTGIFTGLFIGKGFCRHALNFCIDGEFEITTCFGLRGLQCMVVEASGINLKELIPVRSGE